MGLRERKKIKLRRSVQREALRLFADQGYEDTTVEQIADAADISTTTFYRYFPTKEDVVLDDDYDPIVEHIIGGGDGEEPLVTTVRTAIAAVAAAVEAERAGDYRLRVTTAAFTAAQLEAARCWVDDDGAEPLARLMDDAVTLVEPLFAAL